MRVESHHVFIVAQLPNANNDWTVAFVNELG